MSTIGFAGERFSLKCVPNTNAVRNYITTLFPSQPIQLWNKYKDDICKDILHRLRIQTNNPDIQIADEIYNEGLILIED